MSGLDKVLISDIMGSFVSEVPPTPFVSYCVVCKVFLTNDEMLYVKGRVFHKDCFEGHGNEFPDINQDVISLNSNAKVKLVQLKNLKLRQHGGVNKSKPSPKHKTKTKRKSKKKRPKKKTVKKRRATTKRKKTKNQSRKKKTSRKKRTATKRRKKSRRSARKTSRKASRRPSRRRTPKKKTRRRR